MSHMSEIGINNRQRIDFRDVRAVKYHCGVITDSFYRRDTMRRRGVCCRLVSVCPSVRHTPVLCLKG